MTDTNKEKKEVEKTTPPAPEETNKEDKKQEVDETTESLASEDESNEIDYKAELEKTQKRLSQAEHVIEQQKKKGKPDPKPQPQDEEEEFEVTDPKAADEFVSKKVKEGIDAFKREQATETIDATIESLTDNEDERKLIKHIYDNRIVKSGFTRNAILEDLQEAQLLANKKALIIENKELKEALKAKNSMGNPTRGTNQDKVDKRTVTDEDKRIADRFFGGDVDRYLKSKKDN